MGAGRAARTAPYNLTEKQYKFVQAYIATNGHSSQAYRAAYNAEKMQDVTVRQRASELLDKSDITVALEGERAKLAKRHNITTDTILAELEEARYLAITEKQASAAVAASTAKAKLLGLITDKSQVKVEDERPSQAAAARVAELFGSPAPTSH